MEGRRKAPLFLFSRRKNRLVAASDIYRSSSRSSLPAFSRKCLLQDSQ